MGLLSDIHIAAVLVSFVVAAGITLSGDNLVSAQCQGALPELWHDCAVYVAKSGPKVEPSRACCEVVNRTDVSCACKYITREIERIISMEKAVFVAQRCGKPLPHGTKCGSYTVP